MRAGRSGIRDNRSRGPVHEFITGLAVPDGRLSVVSAYFTTFAYDRLRTTLDSVGQMRFLFGEPRFLKGADNAGLVPPAFSFVESGLRFNRASFAAPNGAAKRTVQKKISNLHKEIAIEVARDQTFAGDDAVKLAAWDPFDPNDFAPFFDGEWMLGLDASADEG